MKYRIARCRTCQVYRGNLVSSRRRSTGTPDTPWRVVSADFIDSLPEDKVEGTTNITKANRILTIIDHMTRRALFIPAHTNWKSHEVEVPTESINIFLLSFLKLIEIAN